MAKSAYFWFCFFSFFIGVPALLFWADHQVAVPKVPSTTLSGQPSADGWYVLEEPEEVVTGIFKFKIARGGPKEPIVEAFGCGHNWVFGYQPFPRLLSGYEVNLTSSVASPGGGPVPVRFISLK